MNVEPPTLAIVSVETEPTYVQGFPAYVALAIASRPRDATLTRVPVIGWQGTRGMVGITLTGEGSNEQIFHVDPLPMADPELGLPVNRLEAGEQRRMLVDLTEIFPDTLAPGAYRADVRVGPESIRSDPASFRAVFRARSTQEQDEWQGIVRERDERGSWGRWTRMPPLGPANIRAPRGADDPLRLNLVLRTLFHDPTPLPQIPLSLVDCLDGLFEPEREGLRAELLAVRGDENALTRQVAEVKDRFPALTRWMNQVLSGESEIVWSRRTRR
jgi:hypothetical protein